MPLAQSARTAMVSRARLAVVVIGMEGVLATIL